mgnify:CR=1 FL=1
MANKCVVTGKRPLAGMNVSHSHVRTHKRSLPNLQEKRFWLAGENRFVRLRLSTAAIRLVNKHGIEHVVADLRARGEKV